MRRIAVVTTFSKDGFRRYGNRMVKTWCKFWPEEVTLHVYPDEPVPLRKEQRVQAHYDPIPERDAFMRRTAGRGEYQGITQKRYDYRFDVRKFAHKPFVLWDFARNFAAGADALIWLDADTLTHSPVPFSVVDERMAPPDYDIQFLGRPEKYSECGYLYFNLEGRGRSVLDRWIRYYLDMGFRQEAEWHDSFLFDRARERLDGLVESDLTGHLHKDNGGAHPLINSFLGEYLDHLKGNSRKATGRPRKGDLFVKHDSEYWRANSHATERRRRPR